MRVVLTHLLLLSALVAVGCRSGESNAASVEGLKQAEAQWNVDFASKDAAKIAAHYADDAVLLVAGEKATTGKAAIEAEFRGMVSDPAFALHLQTDKAVVAASGDLGFTEGTYALTITNPADGSVIHDAGSYVTTYRRETDGTWKATADAPVSSVPPVPVPPQSE